jgi:hypothetical protein
MYEDMVRTGELRVFSRGKLCDSPQEQTDTPIGYFERCIASLISGEVKMAVFVPPRENTTISTGTPGMLASSGRTSVEGVAMLRYDICK